MTYTQAYAYISDHYAYGFLTYHEQKVRHAQLQAVGIGPNTLPASERLYSRIAKS